MEIEIVKFDNLGRGIGYINNKIVFIPKSVPGDIVKIDITLDKKSYLEGKIIEIIKPSKMRINPSCPYFNNCGGCDLLQISLSNMLDYKLEKVNSLLKKESISFNAEKIIKSGNTFNYRNKVSLKIVNGIIGFYENDTHSIVSINKCLLCKDEINNIIKNLNRLDIYNGSITIRCNYKNEILLIIETDDDIKNIDWIVENFLIAGIIVNDKCIYGDDYFIEKIDNYLFKVSYNSFFQVNNDICSKLFNLINDNTKDSLNIIDLYCGVGTLGIAANDKANVLGVEIVENAVKDAFINKSLDKIDNIDFICSDTSNVLDKITKSFDTIILDPPRSGVVKEVLDKIKNEGINIIIYVSCNPSTLVRDLKILESDYCIKDIILLDMFPNTNHVESFVILKRR